MNTIGTGTPQNSTGSDGDYYLDLATAEFYLKKAGSWENQGTLPLWKQAGESLFVDGPVGIGKPP